MCLDNSGYDKVTIIYSFICVGSMDEVRLLKKILFGQLIKKNQWRSIASTDLQVICMKDD